VQIQSSLLTGSYVMVTAEQREPYESRGSRTVVCPERLACSAGDKPAGAKVRRPVVRIAGWRETKTLKPIDEVSLRGDYESPGRNENKRRSGLESDWI
jgi:hypothetical protein